SAASARGSARSPPSACSRRTKAGSTRARTNDRSTPVGERAQSCSASLPAPRTERSLQKRVGHGQLPDLGVQLLHLVLVTLGFPLAAALAHPRRALKKGTFPLVNHRRMNPDPARQLGSSSLTLQGFQSDLRLELRRVLFAFRHL